MAGQNERAKSSLGLNGPQGRGYNVVIIAEPGLDLHGLLVFAKRVVRIAIKPLLMGLRGGDDRMPGCLRMFTGVPIR